MCQTFVRRLLRLFPVIGTSLVSGLCAQGGPQLLWSNPWSNYTTIPSRVWTNPASDLEAADDFDLHGTISRIVVDAHGCFQCAPPIVTGATVRFYGWNNGNPGNLLQQTFVAAGSTGLLYDPLVPETVDITLPAPFFATGRHFVSVQMHFQGGAYWDIWVSGVNAFRLSNARVRDRLANGPWTTPVVSSAMPVPVYADLTFQLFGQLAGSNGTPSIPCQTWSELPTATPPGATYCLLRAVKAFAPDDVWAAGSAYVPQGPNNDQVTIAMHWDGVAWTRIPSPSPAPGNSNANCILWGLDGAASNDLWAVGTYSRQVKGGWVGQQVFAMHWDGQSWTVPPGLPLPNTSIGAGITGSSIQDVKASASDDVWFVGDWLDIVSSSSGLTTRPGFLMHWDGSSFAQTVLPIVTGVGHQYFNSVSAAGPNDVWVAGGSGVTGNLPGSAVPVLFHFDGSSWTHLPCATPNLPGWWINLYDVEMLAPNDVWVAGIASIQMPTPQAQYFLSHWDGSNWTVLPGPPAGGSSLSVVSATEIYSVGAGVWRWDGANWSQTQAFTAQTNAGLGAVDALGPCEVFAVGGQSRIGQIAPFAARLDAPAYWRTNLRLPSQPGRAPATLVAVTPPRLGASLQVAIDDPGYALGTPQALAFWVMAAGPAAGFPAPMLYGLGGSNGGPGELFIDLATTGYTTAAAVWNLGNGPVHHAVTIPNQMNLAGMEVFTQGALIGVAGAMPIVFTNGLDLHIGL
ncbi:MAG: hypothetical protein IT456_15320 [Planctomycetes bacterium]|nr:hypothetical protein [Planctomycetota bacterium]